MDDFTLAVEDKNSIYYEQRIPYSSWKLLKKVSNWEGTIFVKYTDKELIFSTVKEEDVITLTDNYDSFPFIDFFYNLYKYQWKTIIIICKSNYIFFFNSRKN